MDYPFATNPNAHPVKHTGHYIYADFNSDTISLNLQCAESSDIVNFESNHMLKGNADVKWVFGILNGCTNA